jgi:hypothetical protein
MHLEGGDGHRAGERGRRQWCRQSSDERSAAGRLRHAGRGGVVLAGVQPDGFHPPAGALDAITAEPAFELLEPVADEQTADDGPQDRDAECHVA